MSFVCFVISKIDCNGCDIESCTMQCAFVATRFQQVLAAHWCPAQLCYRRQNERGNQLLRRARTVRSFLCCLLFHPLATRLPTCP